MLKWQSRPRSSSLNDVEKKESSMKSQNPLAVMRCLPINGEVKNVNIEIKVEDWDFNKFDDENSDEIIVSKKTKNYYVRQRAKSLNTSQGSLNESSIDVMYNSSESLP